MVFAEPTLPLELTTLVAVFASATAAASTTDIASGRSSCRSSRSLLGGVTLAVTLSRLVDGLGGRFGFPVGVKLGIVA